MICISIDASSTAWGWSIFDDDDLLDYGKIVPQIDSKIYYERIIDMIPQLHAIMKKYKPVKCFIENVPLMGKGGKATLVVLGATQGSLLSLCASHGVEINLIQVSTWRKNIGLFTGKEEDKQRDNMKVHSIEKANELFGLELNCVFTKGGNYNGSKSDDDIADSICLYASIRDKYKVKTFGRKPRIT